MAKESSGARKRRQGEFRRAEVWPRRVEKLTVAKDKLRRVEKLTVAKDKLKG